MSFDQPITTGEITGLGVVHLLEAIRIVDPAIRFYQASTSEMFGKVQAVPQNERTPFYPRSPYGVAKLYAHWMTVNYRESYGIFGSSGILFNHESPLRGREFVTRKITRRRRAASRSASSTCSSSATSTRSATGAIAGEYVDGMWRMLQHREPDTYVLATGRTQSVRDFVELAFAAAGIATRLGGQRRRRVGIDARSGQRARAHQPGVLPPGRGRPADRRPGQGAGAARLAATTPLEEAVPHDGGGRPGARRAWRLVLSASWSPVPAASPAATCARSCERRPSRGRPGRARAGDSRRGRRRPARRARVEAAIRAAAPDRVVHLAAIAFPGHGDAERSTASTSYGTLTLLEALAAAGAGRGGVLLPSTATVYANADADALAEDAPVAPATHYAVSKLAMEHMARHLRPASFRS